MNTTKILLLLISSSLCVGLMVWHSYKTRGRAVTVSFFVSCFIYAILRGHSVRYITSDQWGGSIPYIFQNEAVKILGEPILAIVGWIFTIYLSWCLAERILKRLRIPETNLFALSCFAFLSTACICYVVESAADSAGWWHWAMSLKNDYFAYVPVIGIIDWAAIISDFFIPFLLVFMSPLRKKWWRWILFFPFFLHMLAHSPYQYYLPYIGYNFTVVHILIFLVPFLLAFISPKWAGIEIVSVPDKATNRKIRHIPLAAFLILILVTLGMQARAGFPLDHLISFGPLAVVGLLAFNGFNAVFLVSFISLILSVLLDFRWIVTAETFIISMLLGISLGKLLNISQKYIRLFRYITVIITIIVSAVILESEYIFEENCIEYEKNRLRTFINNFQGLSAGSLEQESEEIAAAAPADANYISRLAESLEENKAPLPLIAAHYKKALELDHEYPMPYNNLASVLYRMGRTEEVLQILEEGNRNIPDNAVILANLGFYYQSAGELETAVEYLFKALDKDPGNYNIRLSLTQAFIKLNNLDAAREHLREAVRIAPDKPDVRTVGVMIEIASGNLKETEDSLREILSVHSDFFMARTQLARLLEAKSEWNKALDEYMRLADLQRLPQQMWIRISRVADQTENPANKLRVFRKAYEQMPESRAVMGQLAQALADMERYDEAAEIYLKLIHINPDSFIAYLNLGAVLFEAGNTEEAMKQTIRARDLNPGSPVPEYNIGLFLLCQGEADMAVEAYKRAFQYDSKRKFTAIAMEELAKSRARVRNTTDYLKIEKLLQEELEK